MGKSSSPNDPLSRQDVRELIQLIRKNEIREFELEQGDLKLRIVTSASNDEDSRNSSPAPAVPNVIYSHPGYLYGPPSGGYAPPMAPQTSAGVGSVAGAPPEAPKVSTESAAEAIAAAAKVSEEDDPNLKKVTSPMVGTFYRAPSPDAKVYVDTGSHVEENTVLCIIEAMKLMNEIKAEMRGTVRKILVENGQPVEYGQTMFLIQPD